MMPAPLSDAFVFQGEACAALGSAFMGQLCRLLGTRDVEGGHWPQLTIATAQAGGWPACACDKR